MTQELLQEAQEKIMELEAYIEELTTPPHKLARCVLADEDSALISIDGSLVHTVLRPELVGHVKTGDMVTLIPMINQIGQVMPPLPIGSEGMVVEQVADDLVEVSLAGESVHVYAPEGEYREGDRVITDGLTIIRHLGPGRKKNAVTEQTNVTWDDIGGLAEAKLALQEAVEVPFTHSELFRDYGKNPTKGVMLYGPPGCGKTLLAKATATALGATHGEQHEGAFIYVKGPEILNKWVGESEAKIRSLFTRARDHKARHGYPAVIFIDEADAILYKRGTGRVSGMETTIVPQFLSEMDGFDDSSAVVLLATNRADTLDPAITRDGRIDRKIFVGRPDYEAALQILSIHMANTLCACDEEDVCASAVEHIFSEDTAIAEVFFGDDKEIFGLQHVLNGAMLANVAQHAAMNAMRRDIAAGTGATGVQPGDVEQAVWQLYEENKNGNFDDDLKLFVGDRKPTAVLRV